MWQFYDKNAWNMKFITKAVYNVFEKITLRKSKKDKTLLSEKVGSLIT